MSRRFPLTVLLASLVLLAPPSADAALVYGYQHPDLVLDTETGLIWMPVDSGAGDLSTYSAFGRDQRVAGWQDVFGLFEREFGVPFGGSAPISADGFVELETFTAAVSGSVQGDDFGLCPVEPCSVITAAYANGPAWPLPAPRDVAAFEAGVLYFWEDQGEFFGGSVSTLGGWSIPACPNDPGGFSCDGAATWLVMSAVPVPAAVWLFSSGCVALAGLRVRDRTRCS